VSARIRTLIALDEDVDRKTVGAALPVDVDIEVVGVVEGFEESWSTLQDTPTDLVVVACAGYSERALLFVEGAVRQHGERPVIVLCEGSPNGFVQRVFEAGADDILTLPQSPSEVAFALQKAMARRTGSAATSGIALSPMICVLGPKGGTGKTLTTANLAVALSERGKKVAVVDLDLQFGDIGLSLGLTPERTVYDLAKSGGSLDAEKLEGYFAVHPSGTRVLMAPTRPDHAGVVTIEFLREVYALLRASNDYVVVDTPPGFTPEVIASIDSSTHVCMVGMLDALSLKNTKLGLETLELMGYDRERICVILNRADTRVGITRDDVLAVLGRQPDVTVPSDRDIPRSVNEGTPIVLAKSRSDAARAYRTLASRYEQRENGSKNRGRRLLRRKG
jgi:pilus assembly protein CpaE